MIMSKINIIVLFHIFLSLHLKPSISQTWIKSGYWYYGGQFPISDINSTLFTHLICAFADVNSESFELSIPPTAQQYFSTFTDTVRQKNPSITTLLSIGGGSANYTVLSLMVSKASYRKSFIDSSMKTARLYGFQGLEYNWVSPNTSSDMTSMGILFQEWRAAVNSEAKKSNQTELILIASVRSIPFVDNASFPVDSIRDNLNWVHVMSFGYHTPQMSNVTGPLAPLYDPFSNTTTDYGIHEWIRRGLSAGKLVMALPFYGYAWKLKNPNDNDIGSPATGPAITDDGLMSYKDIEAYIQGKIGAQVTYNAIYVVKSCIVGSVWIGFDDVEVVKMKVSYAKQIKLLGYVVWQLSYDDNSELSLAASTQGVDKGVVINENQNNQHKKRRLIVIVLLTSIVVVFLLLVAVICYLRKRKLKSKDKEPDGKVDNIAAAGNFKNNVPDLQVFSYADVDEATNKFALENKLGEGGYGPVYKGILANGQEIAVKKLSKASTQGFEEFKNEVTLTAKLQHVNLVKVLGFCIERKEQMLIYEYMPNKSLDFYLFDLARQFALDWGKRVDIIEGITQGLLYLQEYSRWTIIHRDLKASNILLDSEMKPKISDFGMAKIFMKDKHEANTDRIVGTYGYVPPEYVKRGLYSTKSDVYSFGVLLLHIISGKKNAWCYGLNEDLYLLEHAYELWKSGKGMEFMDPSLDDTLSSCKLIRCMQIALLCIQENAADRPSMLEVSSMLKSESAALPIPKVPAFSKKTDKDEENKFELQPEICSINDTTMSQFLAR